MAEASAAEVAPDGAQEGFSRWRRRVLPWLVAPLSIVVVFAIGVSATWAPPFPRIVTSTTASGVQGAIGEPVSIEIPSLDLKAAVVPIEMTDDESLDPPADFKEVGWWQRSAQPGAKDGQSLLTGHAVHTGGGVMDDLGNIRRGDKVTIKSRNKSINYRVQKVFTWSKAQVAKNSEDLFQPTLHGRRLVLVSCADWDGRVWESNVIVYALPA